MDLLDYVFSLLILFAIIFMPLFFKQYSHTKNIEDLPSSFTNVHQDASQTHLNNNRPFRNKNIAWPEEADAIKEAANLALDIESNANVTDRLHSFLRKNRGRDTDAIKK
ncbi:hypothetical protein [Serratia proteamaculans]|jgi:hypothetical protein|uniref:hypothetical protein n=1 Tax=Serratia proteamaculans TaxID=28151 RepID=UPI0021787B27|nr:hypothetical protein [Serratia proteamaculans]CAI0855813.1 Uncharacterised protein [Serratia proteamaculans]CAI1113918.1 Uncharacterised protein [Serratia proteamaculans]CAI1210964.1 Uncharacterised protein [Serratia proteamaculans]CAI1613012.1 Uncharacterised protein [Serratia proteamaculans]